MNVFKPGDKVKTLPLPLRTPSTACAGRPVDGACIVAGISAAAGASSPSRPRPHRCPPSLLLCCHRAGLVLMPERRPFSQPRGLVIAVAQLREPLPDLHRPFLVILQFSAHTRTTMPPGYSEDRWWGASILSTVQGRPERRSAPFLSATPSCTPVLKGAPHLLSVHLLCSTKYSLQRQCPSFG